MGFPMKEHNIFAPQNIVLTSTPSISLNAFQILADLDCVVFTSISGFFKHCVHAAFCANFDFIEASCHGIPFFQFLIRVGAWPPFISKFQEPMCLCRHHFGDQFLVLYGSQLICRCRATCWSFFFPRVGGVVRTPSDIKFNGFRSRRLVNTQHVLCDGVHFSSVMRRAKGWIRMTKMAEATSHWFQRPLLQCSVMGERGHCVTTWDRLVRHQCGLFKPRFCSQSPGQEVGEVNGSRRLI